MLKGKRKDITMFFSYHHPDPPSFIFFHRQQDFSQNNNNYNKDIHFGLKKTLLICEGMKISDFFVFIPIRDNIFMDVHPHSLPL